MSNQLKVGDRVIVKGLIGTIVETPTRIGAYYSIDVDPEGNIYFAKAVDLQLVLQGDKNHV